MTKRARYSGSGPTNKKQPTVNHPISLLVAVLAALVLPVLILVFEPSPALDPTATVTGAKTTATATAPAASTIVAAVATPTTTAVPAAARAQSFDYARVLAWFACLLGATALCGCVGIEVRRRVGGVLIDERNRYSLSRLQMMAWTALLFASLYTLFVANAIRSDSPLAIMKIEIDWNLIAATGFSLVSLVGAPIALSRKADIPSSIGDLEKTSATLAVQQDLTQPVAAVGRVVVKTSVEDARLADLFRGEDVQNAALIDVARLQMLLVTTVVILGYCITMIAHLGSVDLLLHSLPSFSPTVLSLILISHSGYLAGKIIPPVPSSTSQVAEQTSRAVTVAKDAADLAIRADGLVSQTPPASPLLSRLQQVLADARLVASDASSWVSSSVRDPAVDPALLERRLAAVQRSFAIAIAQRDAATNAPDANVVKQVQARLVQANFDLSLTGIDDSQTQAAISKWMSDTKTDPTSLTTNRSRFYEELLQLI